MILREKQFESSRDGKVSLDIAKSCIIGKIYNARWVLERTIRDHGMQIDTERVEPARIFERISAGIQAV